MNEQTNKNKYGFYREYNDKLKGTQYNFRIDYDCEVCHSKILTEGPT